MATPPVAFYNLIKNMRDNDGVIASRYLPGAIVNPKQPLKRIIVSRIFNFLIKILLSLSYKDTQCGAKLFKREPINKVIPLLTMSKWAFDVDLIYSIKRLGFKIKEFPTIWSDKKDSKLSLISAGPWMVLGIIRLRLLNSPFKSIMRIYDKILKKIGSKF